MSMPEDEGDPGIPEWVVTFGDMMSLLLTFFIMLVSLSEIKQEEKFQALVDSLHRQFGHDTALNSMAPGPHRPRNSPISKLSSQGRSKRLDIHRGGDKVKAPTGENPQVEIIRPGSQTAIGGVIFFGTGEAQLSEENKIQLHRILGKLLGKPQKVEVRGHTMFMLPSESPAFKDNWELAYERCRNTVNYLIEMGVEQRRIRISVAGANEPRVLDPSIERQRENARVDVFLMDELATDFEGDESQREQRFRQIPNP